MTPAETESIDVLHVDDDPEIGALVRQFLEREDDRLAVDTVTDPEEALAIVRERAVDCVVSDYEMGDWNGLELRRAVRRTRPTLPFILFTTRRSEEISRTALSGEATQYLQKGCGVEQYAVLATRITDAVERYRAESDGRRHPGGTESADDIAQLVRGRNTLAEDA